MTNDPDELRYEHSIGDKNLAVSIAAVQEIEVHLRYGIASIKLLVWFIVVLLTLILWRIW
jgi:hypothetical protein